MTRAPEQTTDGLNWKIVQVFQWPVWAAYFVLLALTSLSILFIFRERGAKMLSRHFLRYITDLFLSLIVNELKSSLFRFQGIRVLFSVWTLGALVLATAYTSVLFSQTVLMKRKLPFTDFETFVACLERQECQIITHTKSLSSFQQLIAPGSNLGSRIEAAINMTPILLTPSIDIPNAILKEKSKYLVTVRPINDLLYQTLGNKYCYYYTLDLRLSEVNTFPLAKNSTLLKPFNKLAAIFREQGLEKAIFKMYSSKSLCDEQWLHGRPPKTWAEGGYLLSSMITTMLFFGVGMAAGLVVFIGEIFAGNVHRKRNIDNGLADSETDFLY